MNAYKCSYRDPKSPLTPLTPLSANTFNFDFNNVSLNHDLADQSARALSPAPIKQSKFANNSPSSVNYFVASCHDGTTHQNYCSNVNNRKQLVLSSQLYSTHLQQPNGVMPQGCTAMPISKVFEKYDNGLSKRNTCKRYSRGKKLASNGKVKNERIKIRFQMTSSIQPKAISPRISLVLKKIGQTKYEKLFQDEEIDISVFKMLTKTDFIKLGISSTQDLHKLLDAIQSI